MSEQVSWLPKQEENGLIPQAYQTCSLDSYRETCFQMMLGASSCGVLSSSMTCSLDWSWARLVCPQLTNLAEKRRALLNEYIFGKQESHLQFGALNKTVCLPFTCILHLATLLK